MAEGKKVSLTIPFQPIEKLMLDRIAKRDRRSLADEIKWLIEEYSVGRLVPSIYVKLEAVLDVMESEGLLGVNQKAQLLRKLRSGELADETSSGDIELRLENSRDGKKHGRHSPSK